MRWARLECCLAPKPEPGVDDASAGYDLFLSYRVATEKDLAGRLHDRVLANSTESHQRAPRVNLDRECLEAGRPFEDGFVAGLLASRVFVPLVSWSEAGRGSVGQLAALTAESPADNVLL